MTQNNYSSSSLPLQTLKEIPHAKADALSIKALVKKSGKITGYQLSNNQILDKPAAISLAKQGGIKGVGIGIRRGSEYLKSIPDGSRGNNLGELPTIH